MLNLKDLSLLENIKNTLGVGNISISGSAKREVVMFAVDSIKDIHIIIEHFDKYPLVTHKLSDYLIFKECVEIIKLGEHLTTKGLLKILSLKSSLNLGLSKTLKAAFPNIKPKNRPEYLFALIPDPFWISGFVSGDGSFHIVLTKKPEVFARFGIHLHIRELDVLKGIMSYLKIYAENHNITIIEKKVSISSAQSASLQIRNLSDIFNVIIPFFNEYPILGMKKLDFKDFKKVCDIIKIENFKISPSVFNKILEIKSGMNLKRK